MKKLISLILACLFIIGCEVMMHTTEYGTERRNIQREYIYDKNGYYQGYVEKSDNGTTFYYDKDGKLKGYSTK